ncbi:MAG: glycoside hydrolase family 78 protein [Verrucomicrobiia bacterium]
MNRRYALSLVLCLIQFSCLAALNPVHLRCEYRENPVGIDAAQPRFSWELQSTNPAARNLRQSAFQVLVATERGRLQPERADLWDSGTVTSEQMAHITYAGKPLASNQSCWWAVRVWDQEGAASPWSSPAEWTMGLLPTDWTAKWIRAQEGGETSGPLPIFRREIAFNKPVKRALAHICGLGFYELSINGAKVGDQVLDPGWTDYRKRCLYSTFDVTELLGAEPAALGVMLGNGMYNVRGGRYVKFTGSFGLPQFILQMHVQFTDGTSTNVCSDASWKTAPGPITFSCIFGGEDYDARREVPGWNRPDFDDSSWKSAVETAGPDGQLSAQSAPPIKVMTSFDPVKVTEPKPGVFVYDLGQNFSGWPAIQIRGSADTTVKFIPGELLDPNGLVSQRSSGSPVWFSYTLKGLGDPEAWRPRFTYYGFRYVQVEGAAPFEQRERLPDRPTLLQLRGEFTHSSARRTGDFTCSDPVLERIDRLILAAIDSNLQSVLTDCPHREKLGWLEVSHLLGPTIFFNYDAALLYSKICDDMAAAQLPNGLVPDIAPEYTVFSGGFRDSPEWGSASVVNPWLIYQRYGDLRPLAENFTTAARYVDYLSSRANGHILSHGLGDWYDIGPNPPGESQLTSKGVTATAIYFHGADILRQAAELLGRTEDAAKWASLAIEIRKAFNAKFFNPKTSQYDRGSQTAAAMPLVLGMVNPNQAATVLKRLVDDVRSRGNQVTAGDVGFRFLVEALRAGGHPDVLFDLVTRTEGPGYVDQLKKGATSLTEAWDANPASSHNHCMLGHVGEWFYSGLGGINPDPRGPGFRKIILQPQVVAGLDWARASYDSISGPIRSEWRKTGDQVVFEIAVPPNTSATIQIPTTEPDAVTEGGKRIGRASGIRCIEKQAQAAVFEVGSGRYQFEATWRPKRGRD